MATKKTTSTSSLTPAVATTTRSKSHLSPSSSSSSSPSASFPLSLSSSSSSLSSSSQASSGGALGMAEGGAGGGIGGEKGSEAIKITFMRGRPLAVSPDTIRTHLLQEWALPTRQYEPIDWQRDVLPHNHEFMRNYQPYIIAVGRDPFVHRNEYFSQVDVFRQMMHRRRRRAMERTFASVSTPFADGHDEAHKRRVPEEEDLDHDTTTAGSETESMSKRDQLTEDEKEDAKTRNRLGLVVALYVHAGTPTVADGIKGSLNLEEFRRLGRIAKLSGISRLIVISDAPIKSVTSKRIFRAMEQARHVGWMPPGRQQLLNKVLQARSKRECESDECLTGFRWELRHSRQFEIPWESNLCPMMDHMPTSDIIREFCKDGTVPSGWNQRMVRSDALIRRNGLDVGRCAYILPAATCKYDVCFVVPDDPADILPFTSYEMGTTGAIRQEVKLPP